MSVQTVHRPQIEQRICRIHRIGSVDPLDSLFCLHAASESLQLAQIRDPIRQGRDALQQRQPRLPHGRILNHHQHVGEETVDGLPEDPQRFSQRGDVVL